ncbi:MAG: helix-turn-helix domain-containing protein [Solirubrobacteraceae bacterium]|jgi:transcriptional regulator GlxA family with amidase domain
MTNLPPDIEARRAIEDELIRLGSERSRLEAEAGANLEAIVDVVPRATEAGIPLDEVARLVGVSRQTLHRWRGSLERLKSGG